MEDRKRAGERGEFAAERRADGCREEEEGGGGTGAPPSGRRGEEGGGR